MTVLLVVLCFSNFDNTFNVISEEGIFLKGIFYLYRVFPFVICLCNEKGKMLLEKLLTQCCKLY